MKYYSAIKKSEILPFAATWMEPEGITPSEISQMGKDKYHMTSLMYGIQATTATTNKQTQIQRSEK